MKKVLYLGWLGHQNIGDELMWDLFREKFHTKADNEKYKLTHTDKRLKNRLTYNKNLLKNYDIIVLGGGSLLTPRYINILYHAIQVNKDIKIMIWGSGIDWIEKRYLNKFILKKGNIGRINEFNIFPHKGFTFKMQQIINHATFTCVRGHYTYKILQSMGLSLDKVTVSGDPGLLLHPVNGENRFTSESNLIAVNWGTAKNRLYGRNEMKLEKEMAASIKELNEKGYKVRIYPIWKDDLLPCQRLFQLIGDKENVELITSLYDQHQIMELIKDCKFTINFKLHANVLSAATGIPFIALGYRFKTFDFAQSIGLESLVVSTDDPNFGQSLLTAAKYIEENGPTLMGNIPLIYEECESHLDQIFELFK